MQNEQQLENILLKMEGKSYGAYKEIKGQYAFKQYVLAIDHVQSDPFATPSKIRVIVDQKVHGLPKDYYNSSDKKIAVADFLTRAFRENSFKINGGINGSGKSGLLIIDDCGQQVIERTSIIIEDTHLEVRFEMGLPAAGRRVLGKMAAQMFCKILPQIVEHSLIYSHIKGEFLKKQIELFINQQAIRKQLKDKNLIAFVGNGSVLPRESGISDKPLRKGAIPFKSPEHLEVTMTLPYGERIRGMGIPKGITLIVGGGYHGKSTLLSAIEWGVYNHVVGDGREYVITDEAAVKVRAEDGRSVEKVDISAFINHLPNHKDTIRFQTENASGSTSQAANTIEALEAGASCLLIDEDTSATNFMIRDYRMQQLVKKEKEPITPFTSKVKALFTDLGVSTILVVGGSGEYFQMADLVLMMDEYVVKDVTAEAKRIISGQPSIMGEDERQFFNPVSSRIPLRSSFNQQEKEGRIKVRSKNCITIGKSEIALDFVEQLTDGYQTNAIAVMIDYIRNKEVDDNKSLRQITDALYEQLDRKGMKILLPYSRGVGNLVLPRKQELLAALNRYRLLQIKG